MKKLFNTLMLFALGCIAAYAQGNNEVTISDFDIAPGQTKTVEVLLNNDDNISSLQFDLTMPEGLEYVEGSAAKVADRITRTSHALKVVKQEGGAYRFGLLSTSSTSKDSEIPGNSGAILTIDVKASSTFNAPDAEILITNIIGSDQTQETPVRIDMANATVVVTAKAGESGLETSSATVRVGEVATIGVTLANNVDLVALQGKITLPEGLAFVEDDEIVLSDRLTDNVFVDMMFNEDFTACTFILSSITSDAFEGSEGKLFDINVVPTKVCKDAVVEISDIKVSTKNALSFNLDDLTFSVTAVDDPTGDGSWTLSDINAVINAFMSGDTNLNYDVNGDGKVNMSDVNLAISKYMEE